MPTPVEYVGGQVKTGYNVTMARDVKAKLSDLPPEGFKVEPEELGPMPLRGDWSFRLDNEDDQLSLIVKHERRDAAFGERVKFSGEFAHFADGALRKIKGATWPSRIPQPGKDDEGAPSAGYRVSLSKRKLAEQGLLPLAVQSSVHPYRFSFTLKQEPEEDVARLHNTPTPDLTKALQLANLSHSPHMDVRLLIKRADGRELELWTTADFLGKASDYYKALFASGAAETVTHKTSKRQRGPSVTSEQKPLARAAGPDPSVDWQDSDDETDAFLVERDWMSCATAKQDTADSDYQQIEVRETAYSTMCAVLLYLQTGHIKFAPIRSSHELPQDELVTMRKASLVKSLEERPTLPPPVSPKSVYRLAHLLERDELQKLALDSLASSLTISGAADELFHPVSIAYDKLRKVVVDFVVKNWKEVKVTQSWRAARAKVTSEPTEGGAQILFDLLAAIDDT